jgi:hypothetical protein
MKTFTRDYRITGRWPEWFSGYFTGMRPCILDIEATGLDPSRCKVCLIALLVQTDSGIRITQFLAENHYEENRVLDAASDFLSRENIGYLVTFNGQAYDIPFLNRRLEANYSDRHIDLFDFDLYRYLRKNTDLKTRAGSMSQMSLENYYGIFSDRQDTITGRESVRLFDEYAVTGNTTIEKIILTHNREDVLQLYRLMYLSLEEPEDLHAAMAVHGFPSEDGRFAIRPQLSVPGKILRIRGEQLRDRFSAAYFPDAKSPVTAVFNSSTASYEIDAPVERLGDDCYVDVQSMGFDMTDDPDCVNGYLILNPRTVNSFSLCLVRAFSGLHDQA